jgi:hypothetical protein
VRPLAAATQQYIRQEAQGASHGLTTYSRAPKANCFIKWRENTRKRQEFIHLYWDIGLLARSFLSQDALFVYSFQPLAFLMHACEDSSMHALVRPSAFH